VNYCPVSNGAQRIKTFLSEYGLQYDLTMSYDYAAVHPKPRGQQGEFSSFNSSLTGTWFLAKDCDNSQGVFLTFEADWGTGTNFTERRSSAQRSLGSLSNPQGSLRGGNGVFLPQLALGYSGCDGYVYGVGMYGDYWSSTTDNSDYAWHLSCNSSRVSMYLLERCNGRFVRLVQ
jgi:hypothetical protein